MWTIQGLKQTAWEELHSSYWLSFAVCLVAGILTGGLNIGFSGGGGAGQPAAAPSDEPFDMTEFMAEFWYIIVAFLVVLAIAAVIGIVYSTFVSNPITVGKSRYFISCDENGDRSFGFLFSAFRKGQYLSVVKTMFIMNVLIMMWSLLFIIPGIIKSYSWRMVPYILADNPDMEWREALDLSKQMTDGDKLNMLLLDLSFIGWWFLGILACGIGILFVQPYIEATWAEFYHTKNGINRFGGGQNKPTDRFGEAY
jgi:hypothetical protein